MLARCSCGCLTRTSSLTPCTRYDADGPHHDTIYRLPPTTCYLLPATYHLLPTTYCLPPSTCYLLPAT